MKFFPSNISEPPKNPGEQPKQVPFEYSSEDEARHFLDLPVAKAVLGMDTASIEVRPLPTDLSEILLYQNNKGPRIDQQT